MATRLVKIRGLGYWAKLFESNRDLTGYDNALADIGGQTTIDVDIDERHFELLKKSGSMLTGRPSPDNPGLTRVKFKRKWQEQYGGGQAKIERPDSTAWDIETDGLIGNGSEVEVTLAVYDTSRRNIVGTRLDKVKVLKLVKYEGKTIEVMTVSDVPETASAPQALEDEIPF